MSGDGTRRWIPWPQIQDWIGCHCVLTAEHLAAVLTFLQMQVPYGFRLGAPVPRAWRPGPITREANDYLHIPFPLANGTVAINLMPLGARERINAALSVLGQPPHGLGEEWTKATHALGLKTRDEASFRGLNGQHVLLEVPVKMIEAAIAAVSHLRAASEQPTPGVSAASAATSTFLRDGLPASSRWLQQRTAAPETATAPAAVASVATPADEPQEPPPAEPKPEWLPGGAPKSQPERVAQALYDLHQSNEINVAGHPGAFDMANKVQTLLKKPISKATLDRGLKLARRAVAASC